MAVMIVGRNFHQAEIKTVLPKFHKFTDFPTRDKNILDQVHVWDYLTTSLLISDVVRRDAELIPAY